MARKTLYLLGGLGLVLGAFVVRTAYKGGAFFEVKPHGPTCAPIAGVVGAEDLTVNRARGWAYVSSVDRRARLRGEAVEGAIHRLSVATSTLTLLQHDLQRPLVPHGLSLFVAEDGAETLMVVNHGDGHSVEIFDVEGPRLRHRRTVKGPKLVSPNDVHASGPDTFFATNDHGYTSKWMRTFEDFGQLPTGNVVAFDGTSLSVAHGGTTYANGVQSSLDGSTLYVSETVGQRLLVFARDGVQLSLQQSIDLGTGLDNIEVDAEGRVWIAAHPKLFTFLEHAKDAAVPSPSQVLRLTFAGGPAAPPRVEEVFLDDGTGIGAAAVAAVGAEHMILGPVFDDHLLRCPRPE